MDLSICIPTYNRPNQLPNCLNSIYLAKKNCNLEFEVCVSDNGSNYNVKEIVNKYKKKLNINLNENKKNLGYQPNLLKTINMSKGEYVWAIGDDDLLTDNSLSKTYEVLKNDPDSVLVYGGCEYIDENGMSLWTNRSGNFATFLLHFGPQLIPQPGALIRRDAYMAIGGLNTSYKWAFDLDLLIRLKRIGKLNFLDTTLAKFRWHKGSLSVGGRNGSIHEASEIRRNSLTPLLRFFSPLWELPLRRIILIAGSTMTKRTTSKTKKI